MPTSPVSRVPTAAASPSCTWSRTCRSSWSGTAASVWNALDGTRTETELIEDLARAYGTDASAIRGDVDGPDPRFEQQRPDHSGSPRRSCQLMDAAETLHQDEAVLLATALVDHVAASAGLPVLFIKGPAATMMGLRENHVSADVDVLVRPEDLDRIVELLGARGWLERPSGCGSRSPVLALPDPVPSAMELRYRRPRQISRDGSPTRQCLRHALARQAIPGHGGQERPRSFRPGSGNLSGAPQPPGHGRSTPSARVLRAAPAGGCQHAPGHRGSQRGAAGDGGAETAPGRSGH